MAEEKKYTIEFDRSGCIGAGACAAANPAHWMLDEDGKPRLVKIGGRKVDKGDGGEHEELDIGEIDLSVDKEAAEVCPVLVIKIKKMQSGEYVAP